VRETGFAAPTAATTANSEDIHCPRLADGGFDLAAPSSSKSQHSALPDPSAGQPGRGLGGGSSSRACRKSAPVASSRARASPGSDSASRTTTRPSLSGPTTFAWRAKRNGPRNRSARGFVFRIGPFGGCRAAR
jgi:hypothetical protein